MEKRESSFNFMFSKRKNGGAWADTFYFVHKNSNRAVSVFFANIIAMKRKFVSSCYITGKCQKQTLRINAEGLDSAYSVEKLFLGW